MEPGRWPGQRPWLLGPGRSGVGVVRGGAVDAAQVDRLDEVLLAQADRDPGHVPKHRARPKCNEIERKVKQG